MEEQNKYYTPDLEDIHVGYEMEWLQKACPDALDGVDVDTWFKYDYNFQGFSIRGLTYLIEDRKIRTKYLDKSDIESCGWTCQEYTQDGYNQSYTKNVDSESGYDLIYCAAWDKKWQIDYCGEGIYWGEIKSINELKKIMQYLKIK